MAVAEMAVGYRMVSRRGSRSWWLQGAPSWHMRRCLSWAAPAENLPLSPPLLCLSTLLQNSGCYSKRPLVLRHLILRTRFTVHIGSYHHYLHVEHLYSVSQ